MSEQHEINYLLTLDVEPSYTELRRLEVSLYRILGYIRQMSGSEQLDELIRKIQQTITFLRMLQIAIRTTQALAAGTLGGPIGWLYAATTIINVGMTAGEMWLSP